MIGIVNQYLADDHDRLDGLLRRVTATPGKIDMGPYTEFRAGIMRHIAMEEKVMLPAIARLQGGRPAAVADRLRLDHGAIVALLVPPPTPAIIATLLSILHVHNELEESDGGGYQLAHRLCGPEAGSLLKALKETPPVPVLPHNEKPEIIGATRRAVARAGYTFRES